MPNVTSETQRKWWWNDDFGDFFLLLLLWILATFSSCFCRGFCCCCWSPDGKTPWQWRTAKSPGSAEIFVFFHFFKACWLVLAAVGLLLPLLLPLHDFVAHSAGQTAGAAGGTAAAAAAASVAVSAMAAVQQLAASQQLVALTAAAASWLLLLLLLCPQRHGPAGRGNTMALKDERSPKYALPEAGTSLKKSPTKS